MLLQQHQQPTDGADDLPLFLLILVIPFLANNRIFLAKAGLYVVTFSPKSVIAFQYSILLILFITFVLYLK